MNILDAYTALLLETLNKHKVKYLIVGGYAVNFYGYKRTTGDIDLWIEPTNENKLLVIDVLRELEVSEGLLMELEKMDFTKPLVFIDGTEPCRIDFLTHVSIVKFEEAWPNKQLTEFDGIEVPIIHYNDLLLTKITSDRLKDKADVEELQKIRQLKGN